MKQTLLEKICAQLGEMLIAAEVAAKATKDAAINEESQPENQYDTRALEASYLAGAQAQRVFEIEQQLTVLRLLPIKTYTDLSPIGSTALVKLDCESQIVYVLVLPCAGGLTIHFEDKNIQIITPKSPLGESLLGLQVGDVAQVEIQNGVKEYEVLSVS